MLFSVATPTQAQGPVPDTFKDPTVSDSGTIASGFVPCSGTSCDFCDGMVMANTIIKWLFGMAFILFMVLAVKAGIKLVIEGNPAALKAAKESFQNAFIGLIIFLCAWLIVDTLLRELLKGDAGSVEGWGPWTQVKCAEQVAPGVSEGYFKGDLPYVPGQPMSSYSGSTYKGGPLPLCTNSYCSVAALQNAGFTAQQAKVMSCIALTESSGNPLNPPYNTIPKNKDSNSTACGLFSIVKSTWDGVSTGSCKSFSQCTNAACNTQNALKLVKQSGFQSWTCKGCNSSAEACIAQYK
jgi:hypothetical protein